MGGSENRQRFNLATMSGVFPGTRTMVYQRVRLAERGNAAATLRWARLLWYDDPPACVVEIEGRGARGEGRGAGGETDQPADDSRAGSLLLTLPVPERKALDQLLKAALAAEALELHACGGCHFWQRGASVNPDDLPVGQCTWHLPDENGAAAAGATGSPIAAGAGLYVLADDGADPSQPADQWPGKQPASAYAQSRRAGNG